MSVPETQSDSRSNATELRGLLAEFSDLEDFKHAARSMHDCGYRRWETHSPFPVHGLDEIQRIRRSRLPWLVLAGGLFGGAAAMLLQWWTNAVDYPFLISGKPLFSLPANIPIAFEVAILSAGIAAFLGMLFFNRLPSLAEPLLRNRRFARATSDRFFIAVRADDEQFDRLETAELLRSLGADDIDSIETSHESTALPRPVKFTIAGIGVLALIPPLLIARARMLPSDKPRIHLVQDMDAQPKFKAQSRSRLFADGRSMRPPVAGTVARGELKDDRVDRGLQTGTKKWLRSIPLPIDERLLHRGRERYNIFCATCHGRGGEGDGLVTLRALELQQGTWVKPAELHSEGVIKQPDGQLFNTITHGIRKMPGYASQIPPKDRWAIVLYLRALLRSRNASIEDVPERVRPTLRDLR